MSLSRKDGFRITLGTNLSFQIMPQKGYVPLALLDPGKLTVTDSTGKTLPEIHVRLFHVPTPSRTENLEEAYTVGMQVSSNFLPDSRATYVSLKGNLPVLAACKKYTLPAQAVTLDGGAVSIPVPGTKGEGKKEKSLTITATTYQGLHEDESIYWKITITTTPRILFHSLTLTNREGKELPARLYDQPLYFHPTDNHQRTINLFYAIPEHEKTILVQISCLAGNKMMSIPIQENVGLGGALPPSPETSSR